MKYVKQIAVLTFALLSVILSIKSGYAAEAFNVTNITATSTQTLEVELNNSISIESNQITSDLKVYKDISVKDAVKDETDSKKIVVNLEGTLSKGEAYSILSISGVEGSMEFKLGNSLDGAIMQNTNLDGEEQGISSITVKDASTIEVSFLKNLLEGDYEFKFYENVDVEAISKSEKANTLNVLLKDTLDDNSEYVGTVTLFEGDDLSKIDIDSGIYDFSTTALVKYEGTGDEASISDDATTDEKSLEETLLEALSDSDELDFDGINDELLEGEEELNAELNAASEDPENTENTQLENLALSTSETPDTGAETWVLLIGTFIINTFYYFSRRKRKSMA